MDLLNQILISLIIIVGAKVYDILLLYSGKIPEVMEELDNWIKKGWGRENFIKYKKYQYDREFQCFWPQLTIFLFVAGLLGAFKTEFIAQFGIYPFLTALGVYAYFLTKVFVVIAYRAKDISVDNIKKLLSY